MTSLNDFLVEIHTEELPPKSLLKLSEAFCLQIAQHLAKQNIPYADIKSYATPRRLAVYIKDLPAKLPEQKVTLKGPPIKIAFDDQGNPTKALFAFAEKNKVSPDQLIKTDDFLLCEITAGGDRIQDFMIDVINQALKNLPIAKRMRWGASDVEFVRPVHSVILLYGDEVINANILGCDTGRITRGHRFLAHDWITIPTASAYASLLSTEGYVIADFAERKKLIEKQAINCVRTKLGDKAQLLISSEDLLNEVTGLVEWPFAVCGHFDEAFLQVPKEVLISSMQDHQRYFPVIDNNKQLLPYFITISNMQTADPARIIAGNERVIRARLADAAFFYETDKLTTLASRIEPLKNIVFQAKLGTLYDRAERIAKLASHIATLIKADAKLAHRAGLLAKADLTTNMVNEFPELQGIMGSYYAALDKEPSEVSLAIKEHYYPRFSGDSLPTQPIAQAVALADRIDMLLGTFGVNQIPTGDKDPYGLRRAALGVLRILIEKNISLDLKTIFQQAATNYTVSLENKDAISQLLTFMQDRLRAWYQDQGITADVFAAVAALNLSDPLDIHERMKAVQAFKKLTEAEALSIANKRVSNILTKYTDQLATCDIDPAYFENPAEQVLAEQLAEKNNVVARLYAAGDYSAVLLQLAELRKPVDDFFDHVMVMAEDKHQRENRILILKNLRTLFLQVADIALLQ